MTEEIHTVTIREVVWDEDDTYLVVPEIQVSSDKFQKGDKVTVIIKKE